MRLAAASMLILLTLLKQLQAKADEGNVLRPAQDGSITSGSIYYAGQRFRFEMQKQSTMSQLEVAKTHVAWKQREYEIAKKLARTSRTTRESLAIAKFTFESAVNSVDRLEAQVAQLKAEEALYELMAKSASNPNQDIRRELLQAQLAALRAQRVSLLAQLKTSELEHLLLEHKAKNGKALVRKDSLPELESARRGYAALIAAQQKTALQSQISTVEEFLASLEKAGEDL